MAQGEVLGEARGEAKGLKALRLAALGNLRSTFGPLPKWAREKIERASQDQLLAWLTKAPTVERLEQLMRKPH